MKDRPNVLLIAPPVYDFALYDLFLKPYGLLRIGKWLAGSGYSVHLVNALDYRDEATAAVLGKPRRKADGTCKFFRTPISTPPGLGSLKRRYARYGILEDVLGQKMGRYRPDIVMIATGMTYWYSGVREVTLVSRRLWPHAPVVAGGVYAALMPEHCRRICEVDEVVVDAEMQLPQVLRKYTLPLLKGRPGSQPLLLPDVWQDAGVLRLASGCPFRCDYCASRLLCGGFRPGTAEELYRNTCEMHQACGTRNFAFYDDALLAAADEFSAYLEMVAESGMDLHFYLPNAVHLRYIDSSVARLMRKAGFQELRFGFESDSTDFHNEHDRKLETEELSQAVEASRSAGFPPSRIFAYVLAGLPDQDRREVERSIRYVKSLGVRPLVAEYSPIPGTALWPASVRSSRFPIEEEPLFHNNTLFPLQSERFQPVDMSELKRLARSNQAQ